MDPDVAATGADGVPVAPSPAPGPRRWVLGLAAWSLLVWGTRIDNIVSDDALGAAAQAWRVVLALSFVLPAVLVLWRWRRRSGPSGAATVARALAWWTIGVWIVRGSGIALSDHEAAFIAVHTVLAALSIGLAAVVLRALAVDSPSS